VLPGTKLLLVEGQFTAPSQFAFKLDAAVGQHFCKIKPAAGLEASGEGGKNTAQETCFAPFAVLAMDDFKRGIFFSFCSVYRIKVIYQFRFYCFKRKECVEKVVLIY